MFTALTNVVKNALGRKSHETWKAVVSDQQPVVSIDPLINLQGDSDADLYRVNPNRPPFFRYYVPTLIEEPILKLGMAVLRGLTAQAEFEVTSSNPRAKALAEACLVKWKSLYGLPLATAALDYGFAGFEVICSDNAEGLPVFERLIHHRLQDLTPCVYSNRVVGCYFRNQQNVEAQSVLNRKIDPNRDIYLAQPKSFWAVHREKINPVFGQSHYVGAHLPFLEMRRHMGAADILSVWTRKFSVSPIAIFFPEGSQNWGGTMVSNMDVANLIAERYQASGILLIREGAPGQTFRIEPINTTSDVSGLINVADRLEDQMLAAIEMHPEIVRSNGTGSYNGREIPMVSCLTNLTFIADQFTQQFNNQIIKPIAYACLGTRDIQITTLPLADTLLKRGAENEPSPTGDEKTQPGDPSQDNTLSAQPPTPGKNTPEPLV